MKQIIKNHQACDTIVAAQAQPRGFYAYMNLMVPIILVRSESRFHWSNLLDPLQKEVVSGEGSRYSKRGPWYQTVEDALNHKLDQGYNIFWFSTYSELINWIESF